MRLWFLLTTLWSTVSAVAEYPHGLGGAELSILCSPTEAVPGDTVNIMVSYGMDIIRPVDLHFDVLQEPQKTWLAGSTTYLGTDNNGSLSVNLTLPSVIPDASMILWKVFLTPHGQRFPNMLAETGISLPIGDRLSDQCPYLPLRSSAHVGEGIDYVLINRTEQGFVVRHALASDDYAELHTAVMDEATNLWLWGRPIERVDKGVETTVIDGIPFFPMPVYLDVSMVPPGGSWDERLAEDRVYFS